MEEFETRRGVILGAATRVFARRGCAQATMQDVAAEAGLSVGALYRYYPGKEQLTRAVFDQIGESTRALFVQGSDGAVSPAEILRTAGWAVEKRFREAPAREETILALEAILAEVRRGGRTAAGGRQLRDAYVFLIERLFRQAQGQGFLDPAIDARSLAVLSVALMVGIHVLNLELGEVLEMKPLLGVVDEMLRRLEPGTPV